MLQKKPAPPRSQSLLELHGETRRALLGALLRNPGGLSVAGLVRTLGVTANAVREHLAALEHDGFVTYEAAPAPRGRPQHLYRLTESGREAFPRRYPELAQSLISEMGEVLGEAQMRKAMRRIGARTAGTLGEIPVTVEETAKVMKQLGYEASARKGRDEIVAMNCVFHRLAERFPAVCEFDLAFMEAATGRPVEHRECMVRGGTCCRFGFGPADGRRQKPKIMKL